MLPDVEALGAAARHARRSTRQAPPRRQVLAEAAAEDSLWRRYEFAHIELSEYSPPGFASFEPEAAMECSRLAKQSLAARVDPRGSADDGEGTGGHKPDL